MILIEINNQIKIKVMKAKWKDKTVNVTKIITRKEEYITYPIITQVRIEYKDENGDKCSDYVNGNEIKFIQK